MFGRATTYCYENRSNAIADFEQLKTSNVPKGGRVELRVSFAPVPYQYWIVCIGMPPGSWLDRVHYDDRTEGTPEKFRAESEELDAFDT